MQSAGKTPKLEFSAANSLRRQTIDMSSQLKSPNNVKNQPVSMSGSGNNRLKTIFDREVSRIYATDTDAEQRHNALPHIVSVITTTIIS